MYALTAHIGGDIGDSHSWRAGVSMLDAKASDQALVGFDAAGQSGRRSSFNGSTRVWIADAVWKWAPNGNATRTNFKLQGEYLRSTRSGDLVYDVGGADLRGRPIARASRAGTCRASTSSCRAGASACAPSGSTPARPTTASTTADPGAPAATARARTR